MVMTEDPTTDTIEDVAVGASDWDIADDGIDGDADTPTLTSPDGQDASGDGDSKPLPPMQKRRRVTRACDECRRKKIKCDGKQPCTHCTVYSYECTYDQPSNRRRNAAPQYIEALEKRVKHLEGILKTILPGADYDDPNLAAALQAGAYQQRPNVLTNGVTAPTTSERKANGPELVSDSQLESMVRSTGQLDLDEEGHWDYHGRSSGLSFVRRMRERFPDIISEQLHSSPFIKPRPLSHVFDSPKHDSPHSTTDTPGDASAAIADLPPKEEARAIVEVAMNDAASLLRAVHEPSVWQGFDRIYDKSPEDYDHNDHMFLPLLYSILALGSLFSKKEQDIDDIGYVTAIDHGFKYFKASRQLLDIADCRDLRSLQAIIFMILFLQSSAKLSTCYAYVGVALRSALRMGLHRNLPGSFNPIESEVRKRVFWVIHKMDTYVGALLGLPHTINDDDVDQELPAEVDDEFITEKEILPMPEGRVSVIAASNAHTTLVAIIAKIVKVVYPLKSGGARTNANAAGSGYTVGYEKIRELEVELQQWFTKLPMGLRPGGEAPTIIIRVQQLLRMSYAHAQMMLYRPFLHYVANCYKQKPVDKRAYACAAACVSVSRNIIHINTEMKKRGLLCGAYWFSMYTGFFAILSLVYFALENPDNPTSQDVLRDAKEGKDTLAELARRSMAADRCTSTLNGLFEHMPERLKRSRAESAAKKRRQDYSPHRLAQQTLASDNTNDITAPQLGDVPKPRRASTFHGISNNDEKPLSQSVPLAQAQLNLDSPYNYNPSTPSLNDSASSMTPSSVATSVPFSLSGHNRVGSMPPLPTGFNGMPLSPTMMTNFPDHNMALPDLSSMMFPSADPFAYPNQQANDFGAKDFGLFQHQNGSGESMHATSGNEPFSSSGGGGSSMGGVSAAGNFVPSSAFIPRNTSHSGEADIELFGPVPMYQMQGMRGGGNAPLFTDPFAAQMMDSGPTSAPEELRRRPNGESAGQNGVTGMNLDELFGGQEWSGMFDSSGGLNPVGGEPFGAGGNVFS